MENKLSTFFNIIDIDVETAYIEPGGGISILEKDSGGFRIEPREFLEYATQDFELGDNRGFSNALSNVKRSIESQSEIIHFSLGIPYRKLNFPTKLENIQKMGLSPFLIFKHINELRVDLEHKYKIPDRNKVDDAIQVAQLFLDVTTFSLSIFLDDFKIYDDDEEKQNTHKKWDESFKTPWEVIYNGIFVRYKRSDIKRYELEYIVNGEVNRTLEISADDGDDYLKLINLSVDIGRHIHNFDETAKYRVFQRFYSNLCK